MPPIRLFISHAHEDQPLATALKELIAGVFPPGPNQSVRTYYSSDDSPAGGISPGAGWLDWISTVVRDADKCVVILTGDSVTKPWLTWEAGAVSGVAIATAGGSRTGERGGAVVPLLFGVAPAEVPEPLRHQQAVSGTDDAGILRLLFFLQEQSGGAPTVTAEDLRARASRFVREAQRILEARMRQSPIRLRLHDRAIVHLVNSRNGLTLEPADGGIANGVRLQCRKFTGDAHQGWVLYPVGTGIYSILTADETKCISVQNDSRNAGATILLWDYEGHETQHWKILSDVGAPGMLSTIRIVNSASDLCLMPRPSDRQIVQTIQSNYFDQDWYILTAPVLPTIPRTEGAFGRRHLKRLAGTRG